MLVNLVLEHVAEDAALVPSTVGAGARYLLAHGLRRHGNTHELQMLVAARGAGPLAVVLKQDHVLDARVGHELLHTELAGGEERVPLADREMRGAAVVIRRGDDDLVRADRGQEPRQLARRLNRRRILQRLGDESWVAIRHNAHEPTGLVGPSQVRSNRVDLRWGLLLIARTERTGPLVQRIHLLRIAVIVRSLVATGGDDRPVASNWISA